MSDDTGPALLEVDLQPGEVYLAREPAILRTILGSCVSATFWSARLGAGAMCHGILPRCPPLTLASSPAEGHRYVDSSIRYLIQRFDALGVRRDELEVKLFGGADVLPIARAGRATVGSVNCQAAIQVLAEEGLIVRSSDLGGVRGRRIQFHTSSGDVLVYRLASWSDNAVLREQLAAQRLGEVEP
ncbi:MAG TPA: chemotaxis protein CheD [Bryobacteraceae bacterium]|nr:chemotaxis protein CheD [Bryobacteraceae bacterium]